jgi:signal transduction histidine kinase
MEVPIEQPAKNNSRLSRRLFVLHAAIVALCLFLAISYLASLPIYYDYLIESCYNADQSCANATLSVLSYEWASKAGMDRVGFGLFHIGINLILFACYAIVAMLLLVLKPKDMLSSVTALTLVSFAFGDLVYEQWGGASLLTPIIQSIAIAGFMWFALTFPSGRISRRWLLWTAVLAYLIRNGSDYMPYPAVHVDRWPLWLSLVWLIAFFGTLAFSQYTQYREQTSTEGRTAIRTVAYGVIGAFLALIGVNLLLLVWPELYRNDVFWLDLTIRLIMLAIPVTIGYALLTHRLWGVPPVVRTTFVYGALMAVVFGIYIAVVWYLAQVFNTESGVYSLIAAGLVAVLFAPLKESLEKLINRILYGKRENPVSFLVGLGDRLKEPHAPEQVLETVVLTVKDMMQLPHASITILVKGIEKEAATAGAMREAWSVRFPLVLGGEDLGSLYVSPRSPDESFNKAELRLLHMMSRESARIVHGLRQSLAIGQLMQQLQLSREQLIYAREEERRSIRNNLHDDLAPRLASLALSASAAGEYIRKDPPKAVHIVTELESDIRVMVRDIRDFVHNLRPPALDQYGLVEAIRQRVERLTDLQSAHASDPDNRTDVEVASPDSLPLLPAAVEVAVYRIVSEALVNTFKHARAKACRVKLDVQTGMSGEELYIEIRDDGVGLTRADQQGISVQPSGVGLMSIQERSAELGGRCIIGQAEGGGTRIAAWLPLQNKATGGVQDDYV